MESAPWRRLLLVGRTAGPPSGRFIYCTRLLLRQRPEAKSAVTVSPSAITETGIVDLQQISSP